MLRRCASEGAFAERALASALSSIPHSLPPPPQPSAPSPSVPSSASKFPSSSHASSVSRHATELVYGVLRHGRGLDFVLSQFASLERTDLHTTLALRIGAYEILHLRTPDHAAVNEAVALAETSRKASFVNAVLRRIVRERDTLPQPHEKLESPVEALAVST